MEWILLDNELPNQPRCINLNNVSDITWVSGTMTFNYVDGSCSSYECEKQVYIDAIASLNVVKELE